MLVVDDNADIREAMTMLVELLGHDVEAVNDGASAFAAGAMTHPELILMDVSLQGENGYDLGARMRHEPWGRSALLIAATGWTSERDAARARDAGFDGHALKPLDVAELQELIARAMRRRDDRSQCVGPDHTER